MRSRPLFALAGVTLLASLALVLRSSVAAPPAPGAAPAHVVLISIDTLRADFLGTYGNTQVKTPNIDAFAADSVVFEAAFTAAPTTLASHTSMMTGTYPHTHGVPWNGSMVHPDNEMLAEVLKGAGFETAGLSGAFPLNAKFAFDQGFDVFRANLGDARTVTNAASMRLERKSEHLFLFVHYFDVHWPYEPPAPYDRMYRTDDLPITGTYEEVKALRAALREGAPQAAAQNAVMRNLYAGEVSWTDQEVGRLLRVLDDKGVLDDAVVILTSDHGESMDEHWDYWDHGPTTYNSVAHVPLIVRMPGGASGGTRVSTPVSTVDILPTVLELVGVAAPARTEGVSLAPALHGGAMPERGPVYSEATKPQDDNSPTSWPNLDKCRGAWSPALKLQRCPSKGTTELFAWSSDPNEQTNLWASQGASASGLDQGLEAWATSGTPLLAGQDNSDATLEALRELGYIED